MSVNRSVVRAAPLLRPTPAAFSRHSRALPLGSYRHAAAILIPLRRSYASETSTSHNGSSGSDFPPPGFDAQKAKQPINQQQSSSAQQAARQQQQSNEADQAAETNNVAPKNSVHKHISETTEATSQPKTDAQEAQTLSELAVEKSAKDAAVKSGSVETKKDEKKDKKLTVWQKVKKEAAHYWDGTKLLATEVRISSRLALKMAAGYELTRRENRQLQRTVQDLGRLVPFSVFVIVPFAELLLPVALKIFPNLLPSTYEGQKSKDNKATKLRTARKDVSNFLRATLRESGLPISRASFQKEEFTEFFRKVRTTGETPTTSDVIKVCKIFKDDMTLDNLSRPQLVGICRYMNLNTFGTDTLLRYQIRHRMRQIKTDDRAIAYEGVDSLSVTELHSAAASRGLRTQGLSPGRLRDDLQMWLDLRLKYGVPSTLLVLSNAFVYAQGKETELSSQIDALKAVLASVPEELFHEIELEVHNAEGAATNKQRLEVLLDQQELIDQENEQSEGNESNVDDKENIDDQDTPKGETAQASSGEETSSKK